MDAGRRRNHLRRRRDAAQSVDAALRGGTPTRLTHFDDRTIVDFDWSADGKRIAVARRLETNDIVMLQGLRRESAR
jgi:hypothetical protein